MFGNIEGWHLLVLVLLLAVTVAALVQVWRDRRRSDLVKVLWTVAIVALPGIGVLGWAVNWVLGRAADALGRNGRPVG